VSNLINGLEWFGKGFDTKKRLTSKIQSDILMEIYKKQERNYGMIRNLSMIRIMKQITGHIYS